MRRSLTTRSGTVNGRFCTTYEYEGAGYDVCDSALNAMLVNELFADTELSEEDKQQLLPAMLFADLPAAIETAGRDGFWDMVDAVLWDAMGVDLYGTRGAAGAEEPVFDWDEDAGRIRASLLQAYGLDWDAVAGSMSYGAFLDLVAGLMESGETPLQQAIYYRTAKCPKETKNNREYVEAFRARAAHFALHADRTEADRMDAANGAMASAFAAEFAAAERAVRADG